MIEVRHLTKRYGSHTAVSDLSFTIEKGVIYGFLGPNGAGKSTTMNIITGCLGATAGEVKIDGHSVLDDPMQAKRRVGYLPEQPPLYTDMTPEEYLRFVMRAKNVPRDEQNKQLMRVLLLTRTLEVKDRLIRNLSKGYRQRVGIAQALLGNPEVIILDEPTVGLDPAQIIEIRQLIKDLGKNHTIVLSSHILSEVQAVCDRIMIISHGRLVASDSTENLTKLFSGAVTLLLETRAEAKEVKRILSTVPGVEKIVIETGEDGVNAVRISPEEGAEIREELFRAFAAANVPLMELHREAASLEDVFLELTRDSGDELTQLQNEAAKPAEGVKQA
ncbi:MAG: ABC transporter ATP-binding protein [Aristaeellaceae bacterium]